MPDPLEGTTFGLARLAGIAEKGPGSQYEQWYPDLQLANIMSCLSNLTYTDEPGVRLPIHVILGGPKGKGKTSAIATFRTQVMGLVDIAAKTDALQRTYLTLGGKGTVTYERLRGSITKDGLIFPLLKKVDFLIAPEMTAFIDEPNMVNVMAQTIEEAEITIGQIQGMQFVPDEEELQEWRSAGLTYNEEDHIISYKATATFIGATRDLEERSRRFLEESGFIDRTLLSKYTPDKKTAREVWARRRSTSAAKDYFAQLLAFTKKARASFPEVCNAPPEKMYYDVLNVMDPIFTEIEDQMGLDPNEFRSERDANIVYQALTASCFERMVREASYPGILPRLDYNGSDVEVATHFAVRYALLKRDEWMRNTHKERKIRENTVHLDVVESKEDSELTLLRRKFGDGTFTPKEAIVALGKKKRSVFMSIDSLLQRGLVARVKHGHYAIVPRESQ